jgi:hypothetical protein
MITIAATPERARASDAPDCPRAFDRAQPVLAGSNRAHHLARADWRFLLPPMTGARVLYLGDPHIGELSALDSARLVVIAASLPGQRARQLLAEAGAAGLRNVVHVHAGARAALPLRDGAFDFVIAGGKQGLRALALPSGTHRDIGRVLARDGRVYVATNVPGSAPLLRRWLKRCVGPAQRAAVCWTVWRKGSMRAAVPLASAALVGRHFFGDVLYGRTRAGRMLVQGAVALSRARLLHHALADRVAIASRAPADTNVFDHVVHIARRHGIDLGQHAIGLLSHGNYDSNKNAFFAFPAGSARPDVLIKVTRTPAFNHRLSAEHESLRLLHQGAYVPAGSYPEALFLDRFGELAVLGQKIVEGTPFRRATTARTDCPAARSAIEWITRLGTASAHHDASARSTLTDRLGQLLANVAATFPLDERERDFLAARLTAFAAGTDALPLVFRHADAGTWNVLVTPAGEAAFLDWEVSERCGPALWDLLDFVQSYGSWMARVVGATDALSRDAAFMEEGPVLDLLVDAVQRYCAAVGLARTDIEPLFYTYWLDRADRQSAWAAGPLVDASYFQLLRASIARRNGRGLRRLLD